MVVNEDDARTRTTVWRGRVADLCKSCATSPLKLASKSMRALRTAIMRWSNRPLTDNSATCCSKTSSHTMESYRLGAAVIPWFGDRKGTASSVATENVESAGLFSLRDHKSFLQSNCRGHLMPFRDRPCGVRDRPGVVRVMGREEQANLPNPVKKCLLRIISNDFV